MEASIISAFIALGGVAVGVVCRDVLMALFLARQKRAQQIEDRSISQAENHRDLVRVYADPLHESVKSLYFRLNEIIESGRARYLQSDAAPTEFSQYKKISTLYRLANLLGWIRAIRRERSYLDPEGIEISDSGTDPFIAIEQALADGQHVEEQRLNELMNLWRIPKKALTDKDLRGRLASQIDSARLEFLSKKESLSPSDLPTADKIELARQCANILSEAANLEILTELVDATSEQASLFLGIKEAYLYRDWQSALGDMMIVNVSIGPRRFDVIGFGDFENRFLSAYENESQLAERRWFDRLQALFHDLDMTKEGIFDSRRQLLRNLHQSCMSLNKFLEEKKRKLNKPNNLQQTKN